MEDSSNLNTRGSNSFKDSAQRRAEGGPDARDRVRPWQPEGPAATSTVIYLHRVEQTSARTLRIALCRERQLRPTVASSGLGAGEMVPRMSPANLR